MPLKQPPALTEEQWNWLVAYLENEEKHPDPKRITRIKKAVESAKRIKTHYPI